MTIRIPFSHTDVQRAVNIELEAAGTDGLKERVTARLKYTMDITSGNFPVRVRSWVHQICVPYTIDQPFVTDVYMAVVIELKAGLNGLKDRVTVRLKETMDITSDNLPEPVELWVHRICDSYTTGRSFVEFSGKMNEEICLSSLPNS